MRLFDHNQHKIMTHSEDLHVTAGKTQWITQIYLILFFQSVLLFSLTSLIYATFTLNLNLLLFLAIISFCQAKLTKNQTIIQEVRKRIHPVWYFNNFKRIYEEKVTQQASMFCMHPHSILAYCMPANMNADDSIMSSMTGLASRALLNLPFVGFVLRIWGMNSVDPDHLKQLMEKKVPIGLLPGGFEEATLTTPKQLRLFIKNRKGFIKYALSYGYTLYPTLTFNEHKAFWTFDYFLKARMFLNKLKLPAVLFGGGFLWVYLPLNMDMITIVGKGIRRDPCLEGKPISNEQIDKTHEQYIGQLERIHHKYREEFSESQLVIY